jgi:hypothetical protein
MRQPESRHGTYLRIYSPATATTATTSVASHSISDFASLTFMQQQNGSVRPAVFVQPWVTRSAKNCFLLHTILSVRLLLSSGGAFEIETGFMPRVTHFMFPVFRHGLPFILKSCSTSTSWPYAYRGRNGDPGGGALRQSGQVRGCRKLPGASSAGWQLTQNRTLLDLAHPRPNVRTRHQWVAVLFFRERTNVTIIASIPMQRLGKPTP